MLPAIRNDFGCDVVYNHGRVEILNGGLHLEFVFDHRAKHSFGECACVVHGFPQIDAATSLSVFGDKKILSQKSGGLLEPGGDFQEPVLYRLSWNTGRKLESSNGRNHNLFKD